MPAPEGFNNDENHSFLVGSVAVFLFGHGLSTAFAQRTIDFPTAVELARKNNPDWRAAEQEVQIARGKLTTARLISPFNPLLESQSGRRTIQGERHRVREQQQWMRTKNAGVL